MSGRLLVEGKLARGGVSIDLSVDLDLSDPVGIFGPTGAGKTTLLKTIAGLERDFSGRVEVTLQGQHETWSVPGSRRACARPPSGCGCCVSRGSFVFRANGASQPRLCDSTCPWSGARAGCEQYGGRTRHRIAFATTSRVAVGRRAATRGDRANAAVTAQTSVAG